MNHAVCSSASPKLPQEDVGFRGLGSEGLGLGFKGLGSEGLGVSICCCFWVFRSGGYVWMQTWNEDIASDLREV